MLNIKDLVNEHKTSLQLLYDCHGLMFESQFATLLGYERRKTNRLVKELKIHKLVKILKSHSSNIVCLTKLAAKELLTPNTSIYLPEPDSTSRVWLGAYSAAFLIKYKRKFVSASHYCQTFYNTFSQPISSKQQEIQQETSLLQQQHSLANNLRSQLSNYFLSLHQFFSKMKSNLPLESTNQLLSKLDEAQQNFLLKTIGSNLIQDLSSIIKSQQQTLNLIDNDLLKALNELQAKQNQFKSPLQFNAKPLPTIAEIRFPDGANNLPYKNISANANTNPSLSTTILSSRNTLYVVLPEQPNDMNNWPGVGDIASKIWQFIILDRGYSIGWYKNLLLQIALSQSRYDKVRKCYVNPPKDKITFDLVILAPNQNRFDTLMKKITLLTQDNLQALKSQQEQYTFASKRHSNWGLNKVHILNLEIERLLLHSSQKMIVPCNLPGDVSKAGRNAP